jgi:hypothetical protein
MPLPPGWYIAANKQPIPPHQTLPVASAAATGTDPASPAQPPKVQGGTEKGEPIQYAGSVQKAAVLGVGTAQAAGKAPGLANQVAVAADATPVSAAITMTSCQASITVTQANGPVRVVWGDGTQNDYASAPAAQLHLYKQAGRYTVQTIDTTTNQQDVDYVYAPYLAATTATDANTFTPVGSTPPASAKELELLTASPGTVWAVGKYVEAANGERRHWDGSKWMLGKKAP